MIQWKGVLTTAKFSIIIPPPFFFIIHVDHTHIPTILQKCLFDCTLFLENTIFSCYHIYLQHFP